MSTYSTHTINEPIGNNWKQNSATYTGDDLIDAFIQGKQAGRDEKKKEMLERVSKNVVKATKLSEQLIIKKSSADTRFLAIWFSSIVVTFLKTMIGLRICQ